MPMPLRSGGDGRSGGTYGFLSISSSITAIAASSCGS